MNKQKLPRCNGRPMMFAQEYCLIDGDRPYYYCRYRIVFPNGDVLYQPYNANSDFARGCTTRRTQAAALNAVSKFFDGINEEHGPLIFLGYL